MALELIDKLKFELNEIDEPLLNDDYLNYLIEKHNSDFVGIMFEAAMRKHLKLKELQVDGVSVNRDINAYLNLAAMYSPRKTSTLKSNESFTE